jgi:DNA-directed RNA polymerase specialized sigma24 family protein
LETAEIAAIINCSANSVYVRLHRALKRLRTLLEEDHHGME